MIKRISLIYLIVQTLAFIGYVAFFELRETPLVYLFFLAIPFYVATLSFLIFIHPVVCLGILIKRFAKHEKKADVVLHFLWGMILASAWWGMILNGYSLSA